MDINKTARIIIASALILIIVIVLGFLILNKDVAFSNNATLVYPDGCVEYYKNGELITKPCSSDLTPINQFNFNSK